MNSFAQRLLVYNPDEVVELETSKRVGVGRSEGERPCYSRQVIFYITTEHAHRSDSGDCIPKQRVLGIRAVQTSRTIMADVVIHSIYIFYLLIEDTILSISQLGNRYIFPFS